MSAAPQLQVKVETASLNAAFARLAAATGKSFGSIVLQNARLIAWNLAHNTQPYGMTLAEKKTGEAAVARDVGKVYRSAQSIFAEINRLDEKLAKAWYQLVKNGGYAHAEKLLRKLQIQDRNAPIFAPLDPGFHAAARDRRGRVARHRVAQIVPDAKDIKDYIRSKAQLVGFAKAGWISAGSQLGKVTRVPAWITRHVGKAPGHAVDNTKGTDPHATLTNNVRYIATVLPQAQIAAALRIQREKMLAAIEHALATDAKKSGFRYTGSGGQALPAAA